jgi:hypothetical protein
MAGTLARKLWQEREGNRVTLHQDQLLSLAESVVVLGEAGLGKTTLLDWLSTADGYARCTARQLIFNAKPKLLLGGASTLVIDALDEVSAKRDGDAVGLVLQRLGELGFPRFVIGCRVADWQSAIGMAAVREQYASTPAVLHLLPFESSDSRAFLAEMLGDNRAEEVLSHFEERGLAELLGNPQSLNLIVAVAREGSLPKTRSELFERAIEVLRVEHRDEKAESQLAKVAGLRAAGAAFAAIILGGHEAIARMAAANLVVGEIAMVELALLPGGSDVGRMIDTRLFGSSGPDRFSYTHRQIGEYVGAEWLAGQANTRRKRRRLLHLFHEFGVVPASIRGIHAWLARDPALAKAVISADPMGVIEYGDADVLTVDEARALLAALVRLAADNPRFYRWGQHSLRGIAQVGLLDELRDLITNQNTDLGVRLLVLNAIRGHEVARSLAAELEATALSKRTAYATRFAAAYALIGLIENEAWARIFSELSELGDSSSVRLAIELMSTTGFDSIDDKRLAWLVIRQATAERRVAGPLYFLRNKLPIARRAPLLDALAAECERSQKKKKRDLAIGSSESISPQRMAEIADLVYGLIAKSVADSQVSAESLWRWTRFLDGSVGYQRDAREQIANALGKDAPLRRDLFSLVLLDELQGKSVYSRYWRLCRSIPGLVIQSSDVVYLLKAMGEKSIGNETWRGVVQLIRHDASEGVDVREFVRLTCKDNQELCDWVQNLAVPVTPAWAIEAEQQKQQRQLKREAAAAEIRGNFIENIGSVEEGVYSAIIDLAKGYLRLISNVDGDLPAHERLLDWLGVEVASAANLGFEQFLMSSKKPTASDVIGSHLEGRHWDATYIFVVGLAERVRTGAGLSSVPEDRLRAVFFELQFYNCASFAGIEHLERSIDEELKRRGIWERCVRELIEPQLALSRARVDGLYKLLHSDVEAVLAAELSSEWLGAFANLPDSVEGELIARLVRSGRREELKELLPAKRGVADILRANRWTAVGLVVDFASAVKCFADHAPEAALIWSLREVTGGSRRNVSVGIVPSTPAIEWIVESFRGAWPSVGHPTGVTHGDTNPWDASEFIGLVIGWLGKDPSDDAAEALSRLVRAKKDSYTEYIQSVVAENLARRADAAYAPPTIESIASIVKDELPSTVPDLQAYMVDELCLVQSKVTGDDAESWRGFFDDAGEPFGEERCRDHLLGLLRQGAKGVELIPEAHVAADKEVDITCAVGALRLPIEIKGQWNGDLWTGADSQLDRLYATDWRAEKRGIYAVLWFGHDVKKNKKLRSRGKGISSPRTPEELGSELKKQSRAVQEGRVSVVVLDIKKIVK